MKQILQNMKTGELQLAEVPSPLLPPGHLLIQSSVTLISSGTERSQVGLNKSSLLAKALQRPDDVKKVLQKIKTDGLNTAYQLVQAKLDQPKALGYCNSGRVIAVGAGVTRFKVGDRVASNGPHAERVAVPETLCAPIPDGVSFEDAAFTPIAAIALQGIRLAEPGLGESVAVVGLGLVGLSAVQLLKANGCKVLGIDLDPSKCAAAKQLGIEVLNPASGGDPVSHALAFSQGRGMDAVLLTLTSRSSEPVRQAAQMCRKRGRIVLVGVTGMELNRADFYEKELSFQISASYGPGRYDFQYEQRAQDYPIGFVRWTAQRNFEAVLGLMASGSFRAGSLITRTYAFEQAADAYQSLLGDQPVLGLLLKYSGQPGKEAPGFSESIVQLKSSVRPAKGKATIAMIGAGNFARSHLLPILAKSGSRLKTIVSAGGVSSAHFGRKFGFETASTDAELVLKDPEIDTVFIATQHHQHAAMATQAILAGKNVFVEKPLAISHSELDVLAKACTLRPEARLMVGFNRRFSPHAVKMRELLKPLSAPKAFVMTVNAGAIPSEHWIQDPKRGGGRIVGEGCHFVDLLRYLAGSPIVQCRSTYLGIPGKEGSLFDTATLEMSFADGSVATIHYLANGHSKLAKERLEVFCSGRVLQLDNFRKLSGLGWAGFSKLNLFSQDKGHARGVKSFLEAIENGQSSPIALEELLEVSRATLELARIEKSEAEKSASATPEKHHRHGFEKEAQIH